MWKMERPDSDWDIGQAYILDSRSFLLGVKSNSHNSKKEKGDKDPDIDIIYPCETDIQSHEIGKIVAELQRSNVNYIWNVMSPIIIYENRHWLRDLRMIVASNMSKNIFHSIMGMSRHNIYHFIDRGDKDSLIYKKKLNTIGRTIQFGINALLYNKFLFQKTDIHSKEELDELMIRFQSIYAQSQLPAKPDPKPYEEFLIKVRMDHLRRDLQEGLIRGDYRFLQLSQTDDSL